MSRRVTIYRYTVEHPTAFSARLNINRDPNYSFRPPAAEVRLFSGEGVAAESNRWLKTYGEYALASWRHTGVITQGAEGTSLLQWAAEIEVE